MGSYFTDEERAAIENGARAAAMNSVNLWCFIHWTLMHLVESQGGEYASHKHGDGFYEMETFDVNSGAEFLQIALDARTAFLQERAENDKSG